MPKIWETEVIFVKWTIVLIILIIALFSTVIISCSENRPPPGPRGWQGMNISDEQRAQMMAEIQQKAAEACQGKNEGDLCELESPRGMINGSCQAIENSLICRGQREEMRRGDR